MEALNIGILWFSLFSVEFFKLSLSYLFVCLFLDVIPCHFIGCIQGAELDAQEGKGAAALAACRTLAEELTEVRFPAPRILAFKVFLFLILKLCILIFWNNGYLNFGMPQEGSSQARYFVSRLIPAHKDPPYEQVNVFQFCLSLATFTYHLFLLFLFE